jgi:tRNA(adenine34) deaminase
MRRPSRRTATSTAGAHRARAGPVVRIALAGQPRQRPLRLAVNVEPCVMCLGAAMSLGVAEVCFGLESPGDGASRVAASWPAGAALPWYAAPVMTGRVRRDQVREQFRRYCEAAPESGFRRWAQTLAARPD